MHRVGEVPVTTTRRWITWKDRDGVPHVRDDIPSDAEWLSLGAHCPLCPPIRRRGDPGPGLVLAIGSTTVVCSRDEHARPSRVVVYVDDERRELKIEHRDDQRASRADREG